MRLLTTHKVNGVNDGLQIGVQDDPGAGGAHHDYLIAWDKPQKPNGSLDAGICNVVFQNGPIAEAGINGVTHEALLAIVIDRLQCFQKGSYAGRENAIALTHLEDAMHWLQHRTRARVERGVEGTMQK